MAKVYLRFKMLIDKQSALPDSTEMIRYGREFINNWTYTVTAQSKPNGAIAFNSSFKYEFKGTFNVLQQSDEHAMESHQYSVAQMNDSFNITWRLYYKGKERLSVRGKFFDHSVASGRSPRDGGGAAQFTEHSINFTHAITAFRSEKANLMVQQISSGTGWYLVKQSEPFGDLMKRIFINPSAIDWDLMRENNKHLGNVQMITLLRPGQIVIIALERNNPKRKSMMADALKAQDEWQKYAALSIEKQALLANLADFAMNAAAHGAKITSLKGQHKYDPNINLPDELMDIKNQAEAIIELSSEIKGQTVQAYNRLGEKWNQFKIGHTSSQAAISARWQEFKRQNAGEFQKIRSAIGRKAMQIDHGIKVEGVGLRQALKSEPSIRSSNWNNGIRGYIDGLKSAGKIANTMRVGGFFMIGLKFNDYNTKINEIESTGNTEFIQRAKIIERSKLAGDLAGGFVGAEIGVVGGLALAATIGATGGLALVVVGLIAAAGGFSGGFLGKEVGLIAGEKIYEYSE